MIGEHQGLNQAPKGLGQGSCAGQKSQRPTDKGLCVNPFTAGFKGQLVLHPALVRVGADSGGTDLSLVACSFHAVLLKYLTALRGAETTTGNNWSNDRS